MGGRVDRGTLCPGTFQTCYKRTSHSTAPNNPQSPKSIDMLPKFIGKSNNLLKFYCTKVTNSVWMLDKALLNQSVKPMIAIVAKVEVLRRPVASMDKEVKVAPGTNPATKFPAEQY